MFNYSDMDFKNKTVFITGASRGIGWRLPKNLLPRVQTLLLQQKPPSLPKLQGTIFSAAAEIEALGGLS